MPKVLPFQSHNALPASGPVPVVPLPVRPNSLTKSDVTALRALMPELAAGSRYAAGCDDAGDVWAIISGGNGETFQAYLLTRDGPKLELEDVRAPLGTDLVEAYDSFAELAAALGDEIGWRADAV
jgi:hypothetical protein